MIDEKYKKLQYKKLLREGSLSDCIAFGEAVGREKGYWEGLLEGSPERRCWP
jgi:hypothetical protein